MNISVNDSNVRSGTILYWTPTFCGLPLGFVLPIMVLVSMPGLILAVDPLGQGIGLTPEDYKDLTKAYVKEVTADNVILGEWLCNQSGKLYQVVGIPTSTSDSVQALIYGGKNCYKEKIADLYRPRPSDLEKMLDLQRPRS